MNTDEASVEGAYRTSEFAVVNTADCQKHGPYDVKCLMVFNGKEMLSRCPLCVDNVNSNEVMINMGYPSRTISYEKKYPNMKVPTRFMSTRFSSIEERIHSVAYAGIKLGYEIAYDGRKSPMIISSQHSTGKTMLGCATLNEYYMGGLQCDGGVIIAYTTLGDMVSSLIDGYRDKVNSSYLIGAYNDPDLLFIDDIDTVTDHGRKILFNVIDHRYKTCKNLIIASSLQPAALRLHIGDRSVDRLREMGAVLSMVKFNKKKT